MLSVDLSFPLAAGRLLSLSQYFNFNFEEFIMDIVIGRCLLAYVILITCFFLPLTPLGMILVVSSTVYTMYNDLHNGFLLVMMWLEAV